MRKSGIVSTVVLTVFLLICIFFLIRLIPFDISEAFSEYGEQSSESIPDPEDTGEIFIMIHLVYAIGAFAILMAAHIIALIPLIISGICLPFAIGNRKSEVKPVRVINIGYTIAFSSVIIICLVKIILFWV